ncbi:MAG: LamG domain-containing protein [Verrucomicrobia bacterium]|nr:LamG domain-containing protein [Actinomycetota bacterium]MBU4199701.1 LamG domain-containing protein [Verrucomicrobiota bacterium]MCG2678491.1 LamG domain-containing protein [Kiritimatiellia bacterium]MBU4247997.1 LamG domain-containing protein [Verrucomicrobiota bacterium]MBU4289584.1 LamG domain-containing protein [Verrucomicrobiota bacterium]
MKRIIGIVFLCVWMGIDHSPTSAASATNEAPPAYTVPEELRTNIIARFSFDVNECSDHTSGAAIPVMFKRKSAADTEERQFERNVVPRVTTGKFGNGLLLEESHANLVTPNQAGAEGDTTGEFIPVKDVALSLTTNQHWQGKQSLKVETKGEAGEEGVAIEVKVEKALYNGNAIVPAHYVASLYLKGQGNLMLSLKETGAEMATDPVYIELSPTEWKRFSCTQTASFPQKPVGPKHETDWKSLLPAGSNIEAKLLLQCVTIDKHKMTFYADGIQLESRQLPFADQGAGLSPYSWSPGQMTLAQDEFSFSTKGDFFTAWKQNGSISFWFKPIWDARDGTQELMLYLGPNAMQLQHANAKIRFYPAGVDFKPYDWKDNWHHLVITWNAEGRRVLYVDGYDYVNTQNEQQPLPPDTDFLALSYSGSGASPNGIVDELILFQGVLDSDQVKAIAAYDPKNLPKPKPPEEPAAKEADSATPSSPATSAGGTGIK